MPAVILLLLSAECAGVPQRSWLLRAETSNLSPVLQKVYISALAVSRCSSEDCGHLGYGADLPSSCMQQAAHKLFVYIDVIVAPYLHLGVRCVQLVFS